MRRALATFIVVFFCLAAAVYLRDYLVSPSLETTAKSSPADRVDERPAETQPGLPDSAAELARARVRPPDGVFDDATLPQVRLNTLLEKEAKTFVTELSEPTAEPLDVEAVDNFITRNQILSLVPEESIELTTVAALQNDPSLAPNAPITVVKEVEQIEVTTPERLIGFAAGDLEKKIRVVAKETIIELTVREAIAAHTENPAEPIRLLKTARHYEVTTTAELVQNGAIERDEPIRVIRKPYRLETATIADLLGPELKLDLDTIFYVRTVHTNDRQGIWGIVHNSLIENFARGVAIRRGEELNTYRVEIPRDADEKLTDNTSSFLGRLIQRKSLESHTYNFKSSRMGRNPNEINPGDEIVIINFSPQELISIYKHFIQQQRRG